MASEEYKTLLVEREDKVLKIILNKPESRNALDMDMRAELSQVLESVSKNPDIRALILTGNGKAFCAGGDLKTMQGPFPAFATRKRLKDLHAWLKILINLEIPVIAAVNGVAAGAGANLAFACDIIIASEEARFVQSFVKVGLIPDAGGLFFLPRLVGLPKAKELMLTGRMIDASEAERIGLVNRVVTSDQLMPTALEMASQFSNSPSKAIALMKRILNLSPTSDLDSILELEAIGQEICFGTEDFEEGRTAFLEKRKPIFK